MARFFLAAAQLAKAAASRQATTTTVRTFAAAAKHTAEEKATAASGVARKMKKTKPVDGLVDSPSSSWIPDPVTGYYRPGNRAAEVDPAELRQRLLSKRH